MASPRPSVYKPWHDDEPEAITEKGSDSVQSVYHVGPLVKAPKAKFTPAPEFSDIARYEGFHGSLAVNLIVGTDGNVHQIRLVRPLGLGLDEIARSKLQTWRFYPATRNGEPVAVEMVVEVAFDFH